MSVPAESRVPLASFRNILFAMDFSPGSLLAFPFAANIADRYRGKVFVAHVVAEEDYEAIPSQHEAIVRKLQASMEEALSGSSIECLSDIPHEILFDHGSVRSRLLAAADKCKVDLIVLGTHGWHGMKKLLKGSTAEQIACIATKPVLTVGPHVSRQFDFRVIIYATDFLPAATHALPYAVSLAHTYNASLLFLHVNDWDSKETPAQARPKTSDYVRQHLSRYGLSKIPEDVEIIVEFGPSVDRIVEQAGARNADLIVMGLHHRAEFQARLSAHLPGSTAYDVVSQASCPVLTVSLPGKNKE
jgi:nucleotide-binding universal stress UspA family protein